MRVLRQREVQRAVAFRVVSQDHHGGFVLQRRRRLVLVLAARLLERARDGLLRGGCAWGREGMAASAPARAVGGEGGGASGTADADESRCERSAHAMAGRQTRGALVEADTAAATVASVRGQVAGSRLWGAGADASVRLAGTKAKSLTRRVARAEVFALRQVQTVLADQIVTRAVPGQSHEVRWSAGVRLAAMLCEADVRDPHPIQSRPQHTTRSQRSRGECEAETAATERACSICLRATFTRREVTAAAERRVASGREAQELEDGRLLRGPCGRLQGRRRLRVDRPHGPHKARRQCQRKQRQPPHVGQRVASLLG